MFALLAALVSLLQPWPMQVVIDHVLLGRDAPLWLSALRRILPGAGQSVGLTLWAASIAVLIYLCSSALEIVLTRTWVAIGQRMVYDLAEDLFDRIQHRSILFHTRSAIGDLMGRVVGDSWCIYKLVDTLLFSPLRTILLGLAMLAVMFRMNPQLAGIVAICAPLMSAAAAIFGKPLRGASRRQLQQEVQIQSHVQRALSGLAVVQTFVQEQREQQQFIDFAASVVRARQKSALVTALAELCTGLTSVLGTALVLFVGARQVLAQRLSLGELLVFLVYLTTLQNQLKTFAGTYSTLQTVRASVERALDMLWTDPEVVQRANPLVLRRPRGHIRLEDVSFRYEGAGMAALRGVNLEVRPGQMLAIVGPTGAGKSTLMGLIPRLFDPSRGSVLIDGTNVRDVTLASLRESIAVVQQEPALLPISIAANIAFARPDASMQDIIAAAKAAGADDFIRRLPEGYTTVLGQRGATLSGGERQRLAIARALLKNAPIVLLDEPTSGLDAKTESEVLTARAQLMHARTVVMIAHRLSTVRHADLIVVLDQGMVIEQGSHEALLALGGMYARFHCMQSGNPRDWPQVSKLDSEALAPSSS
jgi:ATP-binding cassette subfamily B protein/subfamily B ATP-binding cassette protein MsbA